ncbi:HEAT repeat domain-containing protein [Aliterella atlantica]|uniref:PBS lyase n=1 Tax=Aliterella atlantica CENA595 TaxID=1618023 RepID=A0A0D8ZV69_9CYAN|nr:hypothetical protein [Aliterella atlantica]KJH72262.1 hypothetical protein UH38_07445 [Aliterella atlantica CENA595]
MTPTTLLQSLETLTHKARMRQMVEIGRRSRQEQNLADTLNQLACGNFYERYLALQSCYGSQNIELILQGISDRSRQLRSLATRLIILFGDDAQLLSSLQAAPIKQRYFILKLSLKQRRYKVIDRYLAQVAIAHPEQLTQILAFGSAAFVNQHMQLLLHQSSNDDGQRLARRHPMLTAITLQQQAETATELDPRLRFYVNAVLPILADRCPDQALNLCRALLRTTPIAQIHLQPLVIRCSQEVADLVLQSEDRANCNFDRVAKNLDLPRLQALIERGYLPNPQLWLSKLAPEMRSQLYVDYNTRWRDSKGILNINLIQSLSRSFREHEARWHLNSPILATRLSQRLAYAAFLPWEEAGETLKPFIQNPDPEIRSIALKTLVETVRYQRKAIASLLQQIIARRNEQDPIRGAILGAMASLPPGIWKVEHLADLSQILQDTLNAADLSLATGSSAERFIIFLLPFHPVWAAEQLALLVKTRGKLSFYDLGDRLSNTQVRAIAPQLLPIFQAWADRERSQHLVMVARYFAQRLQVFDGLVELLEQAIQLPYSDWVAASGLQVLATYHYNRLATLIPTLISQDPSWIYQPVVQNYLHRHRQDLLSQFLERKLYKGRFSTGKTYLVLGVSDNFQRWTNTMQHKFAETLVAVTRDSWQNQSTLFQVMEQLGNLQTVAPTRLIQLAQRENTQLAIRDRALRLLARRDNGDGIPVLLEAMEDDRARIAIYALRTAILAMSPENAIALLKSVPQEKVTVAKEVVRLIGEFATDSAYQELLTWNERELHRDVRIALLRAFWTHLERDETWTIFQQAAVSPDSAIATMVTRIPSDRLSLTAQKKLLTLLATLVQHPEPLVRLDVLRRCGSLPVADRDRVLQQPLLQRLTSPLPDESQAAAQAFFATYSGTDIEVVAATVEQILPNRRALITIIDTLQSQAYWRRSQLLPTIRAVLAVLTSEALVAAPRWKLAIATLPTSELIDLAITQIVTLMPEELFIAVNAISQRAGNYKLADAIAIETAFANHHEARLRRLGLAALNAQAQIDGWNDERRLRLAQYQSDRATFIAAAAQFIFPPPASSLNLT